MADVRQQASEAMQQVAAMMMSTRDSDGVPPVAEQRAGMETMQAGLPMPEGVTQTDVTIEGVPCRWFTAAEHSDDVLVYLHGGGYVIGSLQTHSELMSRLALVTGRRILGVDYRLAPEHPFPAAVDDACAVLRQALAEAGSAGYRVAVGGDSAGGGLSVASMQRLRDEGTELPSAAFLFSPWADLTGTLGSHTSRAEVDPMIVAERVADMARLYAGEESEAHPLVSPLRGELAGLPPLLVQVGDHEMLLDDSLQLAEKARAAGVEVELEVYPEAFHVFQAVPQLPEAGEALASVKAFLARR